MKFPNTESKVKKSSEMADDNVQSQRAEQEQPLDTISGNDSSSAATTINGGSPHSCNAAGDPANIEKSHGMAVDDVQSQQAVESLANSKISTETTEDIHMDDVQAT